jgi:hypothetical protein
MRLVFSITAGLSLFAFAANAQDAAAPEVRVTGIVCFGTRTNALLEIQPPRGKGGLVRPILRVGEKINGVELVRIDPGQGVATVTIDGEDSAFPIDGTPVGPVPPTLNLRSADSQQVMEIYQELTGRTVLRSGNLPGLKVDLQRPGVLQPADAAQELEKLFAEKGVVLKAVGQKVACAVRVGNETAIEALPAFPGGSTLLNEILPAGMSQLLPAGMVKFQEADILQVLDVYQELAGRTVLRGPSLRGKITVRSQTALTRRQGTWLLEAGMQLNGTRLVADGEKFALALPLDYTLPMVRPNSLVRPDNERTLPPGLLKFFDADPVVVLSAYATLCQRQVAAMDRIPPASLSIRTQTSLTTSEALHGLDVVAALHGMEFVPVDDDKITVRLRRTAADIAPVPK